MALAVPDIGDQTQNLNQGDRGPVRKADAARAREGHQEIREEIDRAHRRVESARQKLSQRLAFAGPIFVVVLCSQALLVLILGRATNLSQQFTVENSIFTFLIGLSVIWLVTSAVALAIYHFVLFPPLQLALRLLSNTRANLRARSYPGRMFYLKDELNRLSGKIAHVFFDNQSRYEKAKRWLATASDVLEKGGKAKVRERIYDLTDVEDLISSVEELMNREEYEQRHQRIWRNTSAVMILFYSVTLLTLLLNRERWGLDGLARLGLGIPYSVLLWGAIGSLACILYRLYTVERRVKLQNELRWLIARPLIGIIMAALAFFAVRTGLVLLNVTDADRLDLNSDTRIPEIYLIVAFLAGFSDRFYRAVVNGLIGQVAYKEPPAPSGSPAIETH